MSPGGKGANQAAQAAMLECYSMHDWNDGQKRAEWKDELLSICAIVEVGKDVFGTNNVNNLKSFGINTENVVISDNTRTGCATIIVTKEGENSIVIAPGANMESLSSRIDELEKVVASAKLLLCQNETAYEFVKRIFELAKNIMVRPLSLEAEYLSDQHIESIETAQKAAKKLLEAGPRIVILTLGEKGAVYSSKHGDSGHIAVPEVKVVETTGAGDSFCGAFAYFYVKRSELELKEQIRRATYIATLSVQRKGTRDSYLWPKIYLRIY
ncbi:Rk protein [Dirofilaria immitis]|nr:Rk protein [Dirofilaria immitis]